MQRAGRLFHDRYQCVHSVVRSLSPVACGMVPALPSAWNCGNERKNFTKR